MLTIEKSRRMHCQKRNKGLLVGCFTSQQQASVSQGRMCTDGITCCHTVIEVADQTIYLTQSQYTDTGPTSPSADPMMPGAWQGSHWSEIKEDDLEVEEDCVCLDSPPGHLAEEAEISVNSW